MAPSQRQIDYFWCRHLELHAFARKLVDNHQPLRREIERFKEDLNKLIQMVSDARAAYPDLIVCLPILEHQCGYIYKEALSITCNAYYERRIPELLEYLTKIPLDEDTMLTDATLPPLEKWLNIQFEAIDELAAGMIETGFRLEGDRKSVADAMEKFDWASATSENKIEEMALEAYILIYKIKDSSVDTE